MDKISPLKIGQQLDIGFSITTIFENTWDLVHKMDAFLPSFIATRALKL